MSENDIATLILLQEQFERAQAEMIRLKAQVDQRLSIYRDVKPEKLTKAELINLARELPPLKSVHEALFSECGFVTGSSVYSDVRPNDIDIVVNLPPRVFGDYAVGSNQTYWEEDRMVTLYARRADGTPVNIICMSDNALMRAWQLATDTLRYIVDAVAVVNMLPIMRSKWRRVRLFRAFKDVFLDRAGDSVHGNKYRGISIEDAVKFKRCRQCGYPVEMFTCKAEEELYMATGVCEPCKEIIQGECNG